MNYCRKFFDLLDLKTKLIERSL